MKEPGSTLSRRDFLKLSSLGILGALLPTPRLEIADAIESSSSRRNFSHADRSTHAPLSARSSCTGSTITCCDAIGDSGGWALVAASGPALCARRPLAQAARASIAAILSDRVRFIQPVVRDIGDTRPSLARGQRPEPGRSDH